METSSEGRIRYNHRGIGFSMHTDRYATHLTCDLDDVTIMNMLHSQTLVNGHRKDLYG